jgi:hypothetical protein
MTVRGGILAHRENRIEDTGSRTLPDCHSSIIYQIDITCHALPDEQLGLRTTRSRFAPVFDLWFRAWSMKRARNDNSFDGRET